jgi:hypothetical protein
VLAARITEKRPQQYTAVYGKGPGDPWLVISNRLSAFRFLARTLPGPLPTVAASRNLSMSPAIDGLEVWRIARPVAPRHWSVNCSSPAERTAEQGVVVGFLLSAAPPGSDNGGSRYHSVSFSSLTRACVVPNKGSLYTLSEPHFRLICTQELAQNRIVLPRSMPGGFMAMPQAGRISS